MKHIYRNRFLLCLFDTHYISAVEYTFTDTISKFTHFNIILHESSLSNEGFFYKFNIIVID